MIKVSEIYTNKPNVFVNNVQKRAYEVFDELNINYKRIETTEAITMEDCMEIDKKLNMKTVKTLFLNNQQKTVFYLFVTCGNKRFDSKRFSKELNISRVSFADESHMNSMLGTNIGATTILSSLIDNDNKINIIIDKDILKEEFYGCSDGTTTNYIKIKMNDVFDKILPFSKHEVLYITMD